MSYDILSANFNNGKYLDDFFSSILSSKLPPNKIVFVDDCSTDNSLAVVDSYRDRLPIHLIVLDENVGFANALNIGASFCNSKYVARLDPDDYVDERRFSLQVEFLEKNPDVDVIGSQARYFDSLSGVLLNSTNMPVNRNDIYRAYRRADNGVLHGTVMIKTEVLKKFRYEQQEVPSEDYGLFTRILASGFSFACIDESLTFVRIHSQSVSNEIRLFSVLKLLEARKKYLDIPYSDFFAFKEYLFIRNYRKYMYSSGRISRFLYLTLSVFFGFDRVVRRINKMVSNHDS